MPRSIRPSLLDLSSKWDEVPYADVKKAQIEWDLLNEVEKQNKLLEENLHPGSTNYKRPEEYGKYPGLSMYGWFALLWAFMGILTFIIYLVNINTNESFNTFVLVFCLFVCPIIVAINICIDDHIKRNFYNGLITNQSKINCENAMKNLKNMQLQIDDFKDDPNFLFNIKEEKE